MVLLCKLVIDKELLIALLFNISLFEILDIFENSDSKVFILFVFSVILLSKLIIDVIISFSIFSNSKIKLSW